MVGAEISALCHVTCQVAQAEFWDDPSYEIAKLTREIAEIAVEEYEEVGYPQDLATIEGEIKLAESDLVRSEHRLEWAKRMFKKQYVTKATKASEELSFKKSQFALEQAQSKKKC